MSNPEKFKKDDLSREAHGLFVEHRKAEIAEKEREGRILHEAIEAQKAIHWLIDYDVVTHDMTIDDVLGLLEETVKKTIEKYDKQKNEQ